MSAGECLPGTVPTGNRKGLRPRLPLARSRAVQGKRGGECIPQAGRQPRASQASQRQPVRKTRDGCPPGVHNRTRARRPRRGQPESQSTNPTTSPTAIPGGQCLVLALRSLTLFCFINLLQKNKNQEQTSGAWHHENEPPSELFLWSLCFRTPPNPTTAIRRPQKGVQPSPQSPRAHGESPPTAHPGADSQPDFSKI